MLGHVHENVQRSSEASVMMYWLVKPEAAVHPMAIRASKAPQDRNDGQPKGTVRVRLYKNRMTPLWRGSHIAARFAAGWAAGAAERAQGEGKGAKRRGSNAN